MHVDDDLKGNDEGLGRFEATDTSSEPAGTAVDRFWSDSHAMDITIDITMDITITIAIDITMNHAS